MESIDAYRENEELCFTLKNKRFLKDSLRITSKARVSWRKTIAGQRSGNNSLIGEPNPGSGWPHEGRDDSRAKSNRLDAGLMDATNHETLDTWFGKMRQLVAESRSEKWAEGHPIWQEELEVESEYDQL